MTARAGVGAPGRSGSGCRMSYRQPSLFELLRSDRDEILWRLVGEPIGQRDEAILERQLRLVTEPIRRLGDVGEAVADVADAAPAGDLRLDVAAERRRQQARDVGHGPRAAAADVEGLASDVGL